MKLRLLTLALAAAISSSASASLVAAWDLSNTPSTTNSPQPAPWDQDDNVTVSNLINHGSVVPSSTSSPMVYTGWGASIDTANYVGFTVQAKAGYQMTLTDLYFVQSDYGGGGGGIAWNWGYRVNGGEWNFLSTQPKLYDGNADLVIWTFDSPIVTSGQVEIGFFESTANPSKQTSPVLNADGNDISLNGSVTPVPETSAALLGAFGALAAVARRRRSATR